MESGIHEDARAASGSTDYVYGEFNRLGDVLRRAGIITEEQARRTAEHGVATGLRFGEAAMALGYIDEATLEQALAMQFDLRIPDSSIQGEPIAFTQPHSQAAEDYRSIRNALALRWFKHPQGARTLAVVSPQRGDGRSLMAANLAVCFAQVGFRTLLIDGDMRNPMQHRLFKLEDRYGLATLLAGGVDERAFKTIPGLPTLSVMSVGGSPPNPQELLLRQMLGRLVEQARERFEMVIFDTPAASVGSDYQIIGAQAIGALVVTHREQTKTRDAKQLVESCRSFGMRIVGSAMQGAQ